MQEFGFAQVAIYACVRALIKPLVFCGTTVETGPILLRSSEARIDNPADVLAALERAGEEEDVPIKFRVGSSVERNHRILMADSTLPPSPSLKRCSEPSGLGQAASSGARELSD